MKKINLTEEEYNNLKKLHLVVGTIEKESIMYYFPNNEKEIIKVYNNFDNKLYVMEKLRNTRNLLKYTKEIEFDELLKPSGIALLDNEIIGIIYPNIEAYTARTYLYLNIVPMKVKVEIFKKIGLLLEKIKNSYSKFNAAFSDVHADNFLVNDITVDKDKNITNLSIIACDTDSMRILDSKGTPGLYLYDSEKLSEFDKYNFDDEKIIIPDYNTDIYCYIMTILDFISKSNFAYCLNEDEYNRYIDYLDKLQINSKLLESFSSIYKNDIDNISPLPYLDSLYDIDERSSLKSFYEKTLLKK